MSKNKLLKILLPSIALTWGATASAETLSEVVAYAFNTSPDLLQETARRQQKDKELRSAWGDYLPVVDVNGGWGREHSDNSTTRVPLAPQQPPGTDSASRNAGGSTLTRTEFGVTANQMLFDGFAVKHNIAGNTHRVKSNAWTVNATAQSIANVIAGHYTDVLVTRGLVDIAKDNLASHQRIYSQIQKRSEGGIGRKADLDQAEGRLAQAHTNLIAEEANLTDAITEYVRFVGKSPGHLVYPAHPTPFPSSEAQAVSEGLRNNPVYRATYEDYAVTKSEHRVARSPFAPRLDLALSMTRNHNIDGIQGDNDDNLAMVRVRWNAFRGGKDIAEMCRTADKMQEALEVRNTANRQVVETIKLAWNDYSSSQRQLPWVRRHRDASMRVVEAYHKQFNIGQRTLLDLLDAENEAFGTKRSYLDTQKRILQAQFEILEHTGGLTRALHVGLPSEADVHAKGLFIGSGKYYNSNNREFDEVDKVELFGLNS